MNVMLRNLIIVGLVVALVAIWQFTRTSPVLKTPPTLDVEDPGLAKAIEECRQAVIAQPGDAASWGKLGRFYLANGFSDPAQECFAEASRIQPEDATWHYLEGISLLIRNPVASQDCWRRAAECKDPASVVRIARVRWAEALFQQDGQAKEASAILTDMLKTDPANIRLHFNLGLIARSEGDDEAAMTRLSRCTESPYSRRKACTALAEIQARLKRNASSEEYAKKAEQLPPDQAWPDPILAELVTFTIGRQSLFIQAEQLQQQGESEQAAGILHRLIQDYPEEGRAYVKFGMILAERGDFAGAEAVLRKGLQRFPDMVQLRYFLTVSMFHQAEKLSFSGDGRSKLQESLDQARSLLKLKPDHGFGHLYAGLALKNMGKRQEGLVELREAVRCTPDAADPHLHLGILLLEMSKPEEAVRELESAKRLSGPGDRRAERELKRIRNKN